MLNLKQLTLALSLGALATSALALTLDTPVGKQEVPDHPQRIVVLDNPTADNLIQLGETDKVIGYLNMGKVLPPFFLDAYGKVTNVGNVRDVDIEKIAQLKPDLIIASNFQKKIFEDLKQIAPLYINDYDYSHMLSSINTNALNLGKILGKEKLAQEKVNAFNQKVSRVTEKSKGYNAVVLLTDNRKLYVYGPTNRFGFAFAGNGLGFSPADPELKPAMRGTQVNFEYLVEKDPDFLFVVDRNNVFDFTDKNFKETFNNDYTKNLKAFKNNALVATNARLWYLCFGGLTVMNTIVDNFEQALDNAKYKKK